MTNSDNITVVLIVVIASPFLQWWLSRRTKREDWARQDKVVEKAKKAAAQVSKAADLLKNAQADTIRRSDEVKKVAARESRAIRGQLGIIHNLVNSNVTALKQSELDGLRREVVLMDNIFKLSKAAGVEPTNDQLGALASTREKILNLETELEDRQTQQEIIDDKAPSKGASA